jgi:hypothetical protein
MRLKIAVAALATLGGVALASTAASAMPNGLPQADQIAGQTSNVEQVRYVCNAWGRCWWRPNWYGAYGYYRPHHHWGWHRWHRWHRW